MVIIGMDKGKPCDKQQRWYAGVNIGELTNQQYQGKLLIYFW
jgi:hypothetical protein